MTWEEYKQAWGENVRTVENANGTTFYVYNNRQLNIYVNKNGDVLSVNVY